MTPRIEEIFGSKCDTYEVDCPTCEVYKAIEKAHQAGIDEAVEIVKKRDTESEMSFRTWERERHYSTGVLERCIKALT